MEEPREKRENLGLLGALKGKGDYWTEARSGASNIGRRATRKDCRSPHPGRGDTRGRKIKGESRTAGSKIMDTEPKSEESILETRGLKKTYGAREKN